MKLIYIETSALNHICNKWSFDDAIATRAHHLLKGRSLKFSPVTAYEILATNNEMQRETILKFCQHLFDKKLLPSPAEIIIHYVNAGMPEREKKYNFVSKTEMGKHWEYLSEDPNRTFLVDHKLIRERHKAYAEYTKLLIKICSPNHGNISVNTDIFDTLIILEKTIINILGNQFNSYDTDRKQLIRIVALLIIAIFIGEAIPDPETIKNFWEEKDINSINQKLNYLTHNLRILFFRGPICQMGTMIFHQITSKNNRGSYNDALHSMYITYVDYFLTLDQTMNQGKENFPNYYPEHKIINLKEANCYKPEF